MSAGKGPKVTQSEIAAAFSTDEMRQQFPPVLNPRQVAELLGLSVKTVYFWIAAGRLDGTFRKRGKHNLFWRDRVIDLIFNGPDWIGG